MSETTREGGCTCGHVRYRLTGGPIMVHNCHCRLCQQQTGSTSVLNAFIETDRIELLAGDLADNVVVGGSGNAHTIRRCARCGTAMWSHYARLGTLGAGVRVGTLDAPASVTPDVVIFIESKLLWVPLPEGIPAFQKYYDFAEVLSEASNARLSALMKRRKAGEG